MGSAYTITIHYSMMRCGLLPMARYVCRPDVRLYFPRGRWAFMRECLAYARHVQEDVPWERKERLLVILPVYRRPWTLLPTVRAIVQCPFVARIIVTLDGGGDRSCWKGLPDDPRLVLREEPRRCGQGRRYIYAAREGMPYVLSMDDDVLLTPQQIRALFLSLMDDPSVLHGIVGQNVRSGGQYPIHADAFQNHIERYDGPCDMLNRVYAFTIAHAREFLRLLPLLGIRDPTDFPRMRFIEDVVASFCGQRRPRCHDLGSFLSCPTAALRGIATFQEERFWEEHWRVFWRLKMCKPLGPDTLPEGAQSEDQDSGNGGNGTRQMRTYCSVARDSA